MLFLDDDVVRGRDAPPGVASVAAAAPLDDVFGGPNLTPPGSSRFQVVQGAVLGSLVGAGPVRRRYGRHPAGPANERFFTLCNLAIRRHAMRPFSPLSLAAAKRTRLLIELDRGNHAMHYDPNLEVFHERRPTLGAFTVQMAKYGRGRGEVMARDPSSARLVYFAPVAATIYLAFVPLLALWSWLAAVPLLIYVAVVAATGAPCGKRHVSSSHRRRDGERAHPPRPRGLCRGTRAWVARRRRRAVHKRAGPREAVPTDARARKPTIRETRPEDEPAVARCWNMHSTHDRSRCSTGATTEHPSRPRRSC